MSAPTVQGDGLVLRGWLDSDVGAVLRLADDDQARRWSPSLRAVHSRGDAARWLRARARSQTQWAVVDPASDVVLGRVGLHALDAGAQVAGIGYGVLPGHRGHGVARRAAAAAAAHGFQTLGLARISLEHGTGNAASCAVALACGFATEGVRRGSLPLGDGHFDDVHLHGRLSSDPPGPLPPGPAPIEPVEIAAGRLQLCVPNPDLDAAAVVAAADDDAIRLFNAGPTTTEEAYAWCRGRADWSAGTHVSWLVKDTRGALLGAVSVFQIDRRSGSGEAGYWVARHARGQGVGSCALSAAARFAFDAVGLTRVELFHALDNVASCRTAMRAGFAVEGVHRQSFRYGDGRLHDEHSHARLAQDPPPVVSSAGGPAVRPLPS